MPTPTPRPGKEAALWAASAGMALLAVVAACVLRPTVSEASAAAPGPSVATVEAVRPPATAEAPDVDTGVAAFLARAAAFRKVEAAVAKAFAPAPVSAAAPPQPRRAALRVARGGSPQACLAQAVYYEARGEPAEGQDAVAQVVLNRTRSGRHPADVCGVVFEGAARPGCQFSFACDPHLGGRRPEPAAWRRAEDVASAALAGDGRARPELAGVLNYHADYVRPRWAVQLQQAAAIGRHVFYAAAGAATRTATGWSFAPAPAAASGA